MTQTIQPHEIIAPKLGEQQRQLLYGMLALKYAGAIRVSVAVAYEKQTDSKPRIAGEDYLAMPGVGQESQFGEIVRVFRRKGDGAVRFTIKSFSRPRPAQNGEPVGEPFSYTTIIPEGLTDLVVTGLMPVVPVVAPVQPQQGV